MSRVHRRVASVVVTAAVLLTAGHAAAQTAVNCDDPFTKQQVERLVDVLVSKTLDPFPVNRTRSWKSWPEMARQIHDIRNAKQSSRTVYATRTNNVVHLLLAGQNSYKLVASKWGGSDVTVYTCSYRFPGKLEDLDHRTLTTIHSQKKRISKDHRAGEVTIYEQNSSQKRLVTLVFVSPHSYVRKVHYALQVFRL